MCGIAGFVSDRFGEADLHRMTDALAHRGPDAKGYFQDQQAGLGLGHRRLSILDLSDAANQPFHSQCDRYVMVYNGEVYNYRELRQKLPARNWKTQGDTEVIMEAFAEWGHQAVERFNGMFAIALWDKQAQELTLFRDRIGIKPLYYYWKDGQFAFASELKGLKALLPNELAVNRSAIRQFLHLGYITQGMTAYQQVHQLSQGCWGRLGSDGLAISPYWEARRQVRASLIRDEAMAKAKLKELLTLAVSDRMLSDVPLGTFLSGGIDSSTVTAIAQHLSDRPIKTFSIGFKAQTHNESQYAEQVAQHLNTDHHTFLLSEDEALEQVGQLLERYDQPFADSSAIPTTLVSQMARQHVTVALSGDGGDEQFLGYGAYRWADRLSHPVLSTLRRPISRVLSMGNLRMQRAAKVFQYPSRQELPSHLFAQEQYFFAEAELDGLLLETPPRFQWALPDMERRLMPAEHQAFFDLMHYLPDDLLVKVDIASMSQSLEVRVPLLDHRVVGFSLNLDPSLKVRKGVTKYLLKEVLYDFVPAELFDRPKWGFSIPLDQWLQGPLAHLIDQYLSEEVIAQGGMIKTSEAKALINAFRQGKTYLYNRLWVLILLHKWLLKA